MIPTPVRNTARHKQITFLYIITISHVKFASLYPLNRNPNLILADSVFKNSFSFDIRTKIIAGIPIPQITNPGTAT
jgi:hypothetical protein